MPTRETRRDSHRRQFILIIYQIPLHCRRSSNDDQLFSESIVGMLDPGLIFSGDSTASTRPGISREQDIRDETPCPLIFSFRWKVPDMTSIAEQGKCQYKRCRSNEYRHFLITSRFGYRPRSDRHILPRAETVAPHRYPLVPMCHFRVIRLPTTVTKICG